MDGNKNITATFTANQYTVTATSGPNGFVEPNGAVDANHGDDLTFEATPDTCYEVNTWYLDGNDLETNSVSYTLINVTANHTVLVTFKQLQVTVPNLVDMTEAAAEAALNAAGLEKGDVSYVYSATPEGCVISQDPNGGTSVDCGSDVNLVVSMIDVYVWTNESPYSKLWIDPLNWDPNIGVPGVGDTAIINPPPEQGPVVEHDMSVSYIDGSRWTDGDARWNIEDERFEQYGWDFDSNQIMQIIDGDISISEWNLSGEGNGTFVVEIGLQAGGTWGEPNVTVKKFDGIESGNVEFYIGGIGSSKFTLQSYSRIIRDNDANLVLDILQDAEVVFEDGQRWCDHGTFFMYVRDNATFFMDGDWRMCDEDDAHAYWYISGSGQATCNGDVEVGDEGSITVEVSGDGSLDIDGTFAWEGRDGDARCNIGVYGDGSGTLTVGDLLMLGGGDMDNDARALLDVNGGLVEAGDVMMVDGGEGQATINLADCVVGSLIDISGELKAPGSTSADVFAQINLHGGRIECGSFNHNDGDGTLDNWNLDICCSGVMVIDGDVVAEILDDYDAGYITVCGYFQGCGSQYTLMVEYNHPDFPGDRTKIWLEHNPEFAHNPYPPCRCDEDAEGMPTELCLSWEAGEPVEQHAIFLHTNIDKLTTPGDLSALIDVVDDPCTTYCVEGLCLSATYYWRVDEVYDCGTTVGEIWCFVVQSCFDVDDMESYDNVNPENYIWETWEDGAGDVNGIGGNGSGSSVYVSDDPVNTGDQAMEYQYDSTASEREYGYSEATRTLGLNFEDNCEAVLALWFYGDPCNASESMWVVLSDGTNEAISTYGIYGDDDADDIKNAEWQAWYMDLQEFADGGVDLSSVESISIGFGPRGSAGDPSPGVEGTVFFDDIMVCEHLCVERFTLDTDLNKDCVVDWGDLEIMLEGWLNDLR
jgi:hypothetical protein